MKALRFVIDVLPKYAYDDFQSSGKWFIYTRTQNINRKSCEDCDPPRKKQKAASAQRHDYPPIPATADDEASNKVNLGLLQQEWEKPKNGEPSKVKALFIRTHNLRRDEVLNEDTPASVDSILKKYKMLKKSSYVRLYIITYKLWLFSYTYRLD